MDSAYLFTDRRYEISAKRECFDTEVVIEQQSLLQRALSVVSEQKVAIEAHVISINGWNEMRQFAPHLDIIPMTKLVEPLRMVKDENEIQTLQTACAITTEALIQCLPILRIGATEIAIANSLEQQMRQLGAHDRAFPSIVASGPNSSIPHHIPTERKIQSGDLLKIDFGARVDGYHADCTRTFVMGRPKSWQIDLHELVKQSQQDAKSTLRAGAALSDIDSKARNVMAQADALHLFTHGLGHGVGLEIHEDPFFSPSNQTRIEEHTVITLEPGAYLPGQGGVRIEDTVVVTKDGYLNLTELPHELITLS